MKQTTESETDANPRTPNLSGPKPTNTKKNPVTRSVVATPNHTIAASASQILGLPPKTPIPFATKLCAINPPQLHFSRNPTPKLLETIDITKSCPIAILKPRRIPQKIRIHIGTLTGKSFTIEMMSTDTVGDVKNRIQEEEGLFFESQILVFREEELKNDQATLESHRIQNDSRLKLLVQIVGGFFIIYEGPGAPLKIKLPVAEPDNVVLLLCKQNSEYFVMDVRLNDDQDCTSAQRMEHIQKSLRDGSLLDLLGNVECVDIVDLADLPADLMYEPDSQLTTPDKVEQSTRPTSSDSSISTSSFISFMTPFECQSRPQTGDDYSTSEEAIYQLLCDAEWMLTTEAQEMKRAFEHLEDVIIQDGVTPRPSTSISLMKLPNGSRPMLIFPKSRPASAEMLMKDLKSRFKHDDLIRDGLGFDSFFKGSSKILDTIPSHDFANEDMELPSFDSSKLVKTPSLSLFDSSDKRTSLPVKSNRAKNPKPKSATKYDTSANRSSPLIMTSKESGKKHIRSESIIIPTKSTTNIFDRSKRMVDARTLGLDGNCTEVLHFVSQPRKSTPQPRKSISSPHIQKCVGTKGSTTKNTKSQGCTQCKKKLGPAQIFRCRCNQVFCGIHRYSDRHSCSYDFKADGKRALVRDNPRVTKDKLERL